MWGRSQKKPGPPVSAIDAKTLRLRERFRYATHGDRFRTRSFAAADTGPEKSEWLEARFSRDEDFWVIRRMTRIRNGMGGFDVDQKRIFNDRKLTFFDAVEDLAKYEAGVGRSGFIAVDEGGATSVPQGLHFIAFAKSEGVCFDSDNMPHAPDENGLVEDDCVLPEETVMEKAVLELKKTLEAKKISLEPLPETLKPKITLDRGRVLGLKDIREADRFFASLYRLRDFVKKAADKGWFQEVENPEVDGTQPARISYYCFHEEKLRDVEETWRAFLDEIDSGSVEDPFRKEVQCTFSHLKFYVLLSIAREAFRLRQDGGNRSSYFQNWNSVPEKINDFCDTTWKNLAGLFIGEIATEDQKSQDVVRFFLARIVLNEEKEPSYPPQLDALIERLEKIRADLDSCPKMLTAPAEKRALLPAFPENKIVLR